MDIVLIAGMWLDASVWDATAKELEAIGHRALPVSLPGQGDGDLSATLADQVAAVLAEVDRADGQPMVVGHSAAASLAWLAADARPAAVSKVAFIGGFPSADGEAYFSPYPAQDGVVPFPGWADFEGPDSADLDDAAKAAFAAAAVAVPEGVTHAPVSLNDDRRYDVPVVLICPEFSPADARGWIEGGQVPELAKCVSIDYVDINSGHWPMVSVPAELARLLARVAEAS